jgi:hypothetical protein
MTWSWVSLLCIRGLSSPPKILVPPKPNNDD